MSDKLRINRYYARICVSLSAATLTSCSFLIPPGIPSSMTAPTGRSAKAITYPEHFAYRIDDHRYITIKGNSNCEGRIYYYDTRLGIRTSVATTGFSLGNG